MKSRVIVFVALWAVASSVAADEFLRNLPADQFAAAGLNKLTPEELARLEKLIAERDTSVKDATTSIAASAASAPASASKPEAKPSGPGWLRALVTLQEAAEKPDAAEAILTRLVGDYDGWTGNTVFKLENGQIWRQASGGQRFDDKRTAPGVKIYPGMMGAYWLEIEGVRERVKVKPVKLK